MERRTDKHKSLEVTPEKNSRVQKNKYLYDEMNSKIGYEELNTISTDTEINLSTINLKNPNREDYQKIKEYKNLIGSDDKKEIVLQPKEDKPKNFDINAVLEEAKKNRKTEDELEKKRNIKDEEYSVLSNLNKKYLHKKDFSEEDDEELKELIDTITSKTLVDDIKDEEEKELLSDLLATTIDVKLEKELSKEEIQALYEKTSEEDDDESDDDSKLTNSFYTGSMELLKEDLADEEEDEENNEENEESKGNGLKIFLIVILLLLILSIVAYFLLKHFGVAFN